MFADPRDIMLAPIISEKSYGLLDSDNYTFEVHPQANKTQIKIAVEQVFNVKVTRREHAQPAGQAQAHPVRLRPAQQLKRAIVTLPAGNRIDVFGQI